MHNFLCSTKLSNNLDKNNLSLQIHINMYRILLSTNSTQAFAKLSSHKSFLFDQVSISIKVAPNKIIKIIDVFRISGREI